MIEAIRNEEHIERLMADIVGRCQHRLFIATADIKDLHIPQAARRSISIVKEFHRLSQDGIRIQVLHGGVPSGPFREELKEGIPEHLTMRRCTRMHVKAVIADGTKMYLGSANLTGAGLGAKGHRRRNFEAGIITDETALIDPVLDMLMSVWNAEHCGQCGRREHCPVPLEEPAGAV